MVVAEFVNPAHAHQSQCENQHKSCMGAAAGGFTSHKAWKKMANEVEALDYRFLEEEFQLTKPKL